MEALNDLAVRDYHEGTRLLSEAENTLARSVCEVADRSQVGPEADTLGEAVKASKQWLAANNYSGARRTVAACTRIISVACQLPRWESLRSMLNTAIVQQRQLAEKFTAMDQENSKRKEEFNRVQAEAKTSGEKIGKVVLYGGMGISLVLMLAHCSRLSNTEDKALLFFFGTPVWYFAGGFVFVMLGAMVGSLYEWTIHARRWTDNPELRKAAAEADEAQQTVVRFTADLSYLEKATIQALTELKNCWQPNECPEQRT